MLCKEERKGRREGRNEGRREGRRNEDERKGEVGSHVCRIETFSLSFASLPPLREIKSH